MLGTIEESANYLKKIIHSRPQTAIILGSGLGELADHINDKQEIGYETIPNFPVSTVEGHGGKLIFGKLGGKEVMAMQGRFHYYEGYDMKKVTFPIRVMKALGIQNLFVSNAAGGMNPDFVVGDIMFINDHINLFPEHPLRGRNYNELGPRFPNMSDAYSEKFLQMAEKIASENNIKVQKGVYVGTQGPTYETPAEYKYFRIIGGDAVGMSTIPEVIVARHSGMNLFAVSVITDMWHEGNPVKVSHEEVLEAANSAQHKMTLIMKELLKTNIIEMEKKRTEIGVFR